MKAPRLLWDLGAAYDLLVSLIILHDPARFGVRGLWAAGMRSRLPPGPRDFLAEVQNSVVRFVPLGWLYSLPDPKDGATLLWALEQVPPAARLPAMVLRYDAPEPMVALLHEVAARGWWTAADEETLWSTLDRAGMMPVPPRRSMSTLLRWWANAAEFGERYLEALQAYYDVFFAEEEQRIRPTLQQALAEAQLLADRLPLPRLLENLSQGVRFAALPDVSEVVLAPSYWSSPLLFYSQIGPDRWFFLFGARPMDASLVPGEVVPEALTQTLKTLSDPTRLRILRYLSTQTLTPTELAQRLRLRSPTVVYHLNMLRMAGLVTVVMSEGSERGYAARLTQLGELFRALEAFLASPEAEDDPGVVAATPTSRVE